MTSRMKAGSYVVAVLFLAVVLPTGLIFAINVSIDPYYEWRFAPTFAANINLSYEMGLMGRISRAYQVRFFRPKHIVLGSSRSSLGINENHEAWPEGRCYNLSVFGSGIEESLAYLRHAQGVSALDTVVLGLDLFSFNQTRTPLLPNYEEVLSYKDGQFGWQIARARTTASVNTFAESWKRIRLGESPTGNQGKSMPSNPRMFRTGIRWIVDWYFSAGESRFAFAGDQGKSSFESYRELLTFCHENNINLKLFICPFHAVQMEVLDGFGLWEAFEIWKRELARINEETARQFDQAPFPLWDFAEYSFITMEAVPRKDDVKGEMKYFFDPNHYKYEVGDKILDTLLDGVQTPGFGEPLASDSIEERLARIRRDREIWRETHPEDFEEFRTLATKVRPKGAIVDISY